MSEYKAKRPFQLVLIPTLALLTGILLLAGSAQAQPNASGQLTAVVSPTAVRNGFVHLVPTEGAPAPNGSTTVGTKFILDLYVNVGSNASPNGATAVQSYMTYNSSVIAVIPANGSCSSIPNNTTIAPDPTVFDSVLQNEVCNGPVGCTLRGVSLQPGNLAFASGALADCPTGCPDATHTDPNFKVASITFCAVGGGTSTIHWQFAPQVPATRDSEIVLFDGSLVQDRSRYQDYVINVQGITATPGPPTWTPGVEPTSPPGAQCPMNFSDVPSSNEFYQYIQQLYCRDTSPRIITGFSNGTFRPYENTKRAQLAKIIVLAFRIRTNTAGGPHFTDVPQSLGDTYNYVETAYNSQIITGYANRLFKPWDLVKRGQVAKMVVKAANITNNVSGGPHFSDVPASNEFYQYIETAFNNNIITGFSDRTFRPYTNATRGQISKIVSGPAPH